jgi:hypothetical protein
MGKYHCTFDLLFDWFGLVCFANKNKIVSSHTADSKPVKQEVNGTVILPPLVFPGLKQKKCFAFFSIFFFFGAATFSMTTLCITITNVVLNITVRHMKIEEHVLDTDAGKQLS